MHTIKEGIRLFFYLMSCAHYKVSAVPKKKIMISAEWVKVYNVFFFCFFRRFRKLCHNPLVVSDFHSFVSAYFLRYRIHNEGTNYTLCNGHHRVPCVTIMPNMNMKLPQDILLYKILVYNTNHILLYLYAEVVLFLFFFAKG